MTEIQARLFALQDPAYRDFQAKLIPTVDPGRVIGVRTPALRKLAKELRGSPEAEAFLQALPHEYYEENNLHAFLIEGLRDYDACVAALDAFLPWVDNWATCDSMSPPVFRRQVPRLRGEIRRWMASAHTYTVRYGIGMLLRYCLGEEFCPADLKAVAALTSEEYYIRMMVAWYFATALAFQWEVALPYLTGGRLPEWTRRKTIRKAIESYRITPEQKALLRSL